MYHALLLKTDYRDKGRGHDRRLGHLARFHPIIAKRKLIFIVLCCSLGSYQSEGESSRPPSGRRLTPIDHAPQISVADSVIPSPPSGPVRLKLFFIVIVTSQHSELLLV